MSVAGPLQAWERLLRHHRMTRRPVNVVVAYSADAAAACATLSALLRAFRVAFHVHPVGGYDELRDVVAQTDMAHDTSLAPSSNNDNNNNEATALRDSELFLLIGLGAPVRLSTYFAWSRHVVHVLDAYRPVHLDNLRDEDTHTEQLLLWGSAAMRRAVDAFFARQQYLDAVQRRRRRRRQQQQQQPTSSSSHARTRQRRRRWRDDDAVQAQQLSTDEDDDDEDADEDDDDAASDEDDVSSQERVDWRHTTTHDKDNNNNNSDGAVVTPRRPSTKTTLPAHLEQLYYAAEGAGRSCALEAYELAVLLHRFREVHLWHAAVGVCDLLRRRLIDYSTYLLTMRPLHDAVSLHASVHRASALEDVTAETANRNHVIDDAYSRSHHGDSGSHAEQQQQQQQRLRRLARLRTTTMQLRNHDEAQLFLLRHTSLWQAIWLHPLLASVLRLHHAEEGRGVLSQLLASRCGVSMKMAQQPWRELTRELRSEALTRVQSEMRLLLSRRCNFATPPNEMRCVTRVLGYSTPVSTFDACTLFDAVVATPLSSSSSSCATLLSFAECDVQAAIAAAAATHDTSSNNSNDNDVNSPGTTSAAAVSAALRTLRNARLREHRRACFWRAYAVLDADANERVFVDAVREAVALQCAVADATAALMQPGMLQSTRGVHYAHPHDASKTTTTLETFGDVHRLRALADRLLYTLTIERGVDYYTGAVRPLLLCGVVPRARCVAAATTAAAAASSSSLGAAVDVTDVAATTAATTATATTALRTGRSSDGRGADGECVMAASSAALADEDDYVMLLAHEGSSSSSSSSKNKTTTVAADDDNDDDAAATAVPSPLAAVARFDRCVGDEDEFAVLPRRVYTQRLCVSVAGRENTMHVAELLHLLSLEAWHPRRHGSSATNDGDDGDDAADEGGDEDEDGDEDAENATDSDDDESNDDATDDIDDSDATQ